MAELAEQAEDFVWDPSKPMSYWRDFVSDALTTSETYEAMEEYELAYIERSRALSVLLERLPSHEDYDDEVPPMSREYVEATIPSMLDGLDRLAAVLRERQHARDAWQPSRPTTPIADHRQSGYGHARCTCPHCVGMLPDSPGSSGSGDGPGYGYSEPARRVSFPGAWADQDLDGARDGVDDDVYGDAALARVLEESRVLEERRMMAAQNYGIPADTKASTSQRTPLDARGLCVVCQDEEADMAVVDCGHLAMCRGCCHQIMADTRECPLCRTHIVDHSRLLRVYKT